MHDVLQTENLNPRQREAVYFGDGPLLVLAGAGSGKTRVLTHRLAQLVHGRGVPPARLLAFTFTNRAAREMQERIGRLIGAAPGLWVGTFHSICVRILRRHAELVGRSGHFTIYDADDQRRLIKRCLKDLGVPDQELKPQVVHQEISRAKNALLGPEQLAAAAGDELDARIPAAYREYDRRLADADAFDFDDLILRTIELLRADAEVNAHYAERFRHVLVDEYQDTNHAQYVLITRLAGHHRNLAAVGDDDQSIYSWRGADIRNILSFEETYPDATLIRLEQNYRSTRRILRVANQVVEPIHGRKPKTLWTENEEGERLRLWLVEDHQEEAEVLCDEVEEHCAAGDLSLSECVILYRTHAQSQPLETCLRRRGILYDIVGGISFYERRQVKDILAYLRLVATPADDLAFLRVVNLPKRGIGQTSVERLVTWARAAGVSLDQAARRAAEVETLGAAARRRLGEFHGLVETLRARRELAVPEQIAGIVEAVHYREFLEEDDPLTAEGRAEDLDQLAEAAGAYATSSGDESLTGFLAEVALYSDLDAVADEGERLTLMTAHNAKGLEFDLVMVAGLEQGLFPHGNSLGDAAEMDEERRLFYVALTRARRQAILSAALVRQRFGRTEDQEVSEFVRELAEQAGDDLEVLNRTSYDDQALLTGELRGGEWGGGWGGNRSPGGGWRGQPRRIAPGTGRPAARGTSDQHGAETTLFDPADEVQLDPEEWSLMVGAPVMHSKFGRGTVVGQDGSGPDARMTVRFEGAVTKKVVARYLSPLED
jgi:DNA helicase-2/ATP-dependent DNA helicase PcrA